MWRAEDDALLERLENEAALDRLYRHHVGAAAERAPLHPRAGGLVAEARRMPGGEAAVRAALEGDVGKLARLVDQPPLRDRTPAMLHHIALYFAKVASTTESATPDIAANAWMRSLAAWMALGEERSYLQVLEEAILGIDEKAPAAAKAKPRAELVPPERVPLDVLADLGKRAEGTTRDLAPRGRAALLALSWVGEAARIAGAKEDTTRRVRAAAERGRAAALDAALALVGEELDEANVRGDLTTKGRTILARAIDVWAWSGNDEAVEQFVADRLATIGWELYRAHDWPGLRLTFDPFRPIIESFAQRLEKDPTRIAFAAPCAQMLVFLTDIEAVPARKMELAERAVRLCPSHRNGRLNLASLLLDDAMSAMRNMVIFTRKGEIDRIAALVERAEQLYPQSTELPEAKTMLERVRRVRITL